MPLYDFQCKECSKVVEKYAKIEEETQECDCGGEMKRLITTSFSAHGDIDPYLDENIGREPVWIKSKKHRRQVMKREGVYESYGKRWI